MNASLVVSEFIVDIVVGATVENSATVVESKDKVVDSFDVETEPVVAAIGVRPFVVGSSAVVSEVVTPVVVP